MLFLMLPVHQRYLVPYVNRQAWIMDLRRLAQADSLTNIANTAWIINAVHEERHWPVVPCQWNSIWGSALCIQLYMFSLCPKSSNRQIQRASLVNATGKFAAVLYWGSCVCGTWWQKDVVPQIQSHMKTSRCVMKAPPLYPTWKNSHQQHLPLKWCLMCCLIFRIPTFKCQIR